MLSVDVWAGWSVNCSNAIAKRSPASNSLLKIKALDQAAVVWKIGV